MQAHTGSHFYPLNSHPNCSTGGRYATIGVLTFYPMRYNKLVRDKIIEIVEARGGQATFHVADQAEYWQKLKEKLREEVEEFMEAESQEELADVFEVIDALLKEKGWSDADIVAVQDKKRKERGGFDERIILEKS